MAANDKQTLMERRAVKLGELSRFDLPPFPQLPSSFLQRFPELKQYEEEKKRWIENLTLALNKVLSASQQ